MRKKVAFGLVAVVIVGTVVMVLWTPQAEPPLRVGMDDDEVEQVMSDRDAEPIDAIKIWTPFPEYHSKPDSLGNRQRFTIRFDDNRQVVGWKVEPLPRARPPWLDRALKAAGW